jgi:hypothetical protein
MKMDKLDWPPIQERIECGNIHLQLEEWVKISEKYSDKLSSFSKEKAVETLSLATRDWLVSTELPHFIKEDEDPDKSMGRFYLYLLAGLYPKILVKKCPICG